MDRFPAANFTPISAAIGGTLIGLSSVPLDVDNTTTPVTFWIGSNHGARIVKVGPTD
jgi:hypothetical protein